MSKKKATYKELEDLKELKQSKSKTNRCTSCGDIHEVGGNSENYRCPNCGWDLTVKK